MGNKSIYCKKNMIYPVSIGGFVEKDRALLYNMPRICKKEWF